MKTEDILEREAEVRAMREALATYIVVFDFERVRAGRARDTISGDEPHSPLEGSLSESPVVGLRGPGASP